LRQPLIIFEATNILVTLRQDTRHGAFVITATHSKGGQRQSVEVNCHDASEGDNAWQDFREQCEIYMEDWT
jgi:hypothetical protein